MRTWLAIALSVLLPILGLAGIGEAQTGVALQGTLQSVDCQAGTVVLDTANGTNTLPLAQGSTAVVNSTTIPLCNLQDYQYAGATATVWLVASDSQFLVNEIEVMGPIAYASAPAQSISPVPIWGVVLGTIIVAGLLYLLVHGRDGDYYRYPYYGWYHRHYYHREYQPYFGYYPAPASIVIVAVAQPIAGFVLGTVYADDREYLLCRDSGGNFYRYPYFGPYRAYYYRPTYGPYTGGPTIVNNTTVNNITVNNINISNVVYHAPVRVGDSHWDPPAVRAAVQVNRPPVTGGGPPRQPQPMYQPPRQQPDPRQLPPAYQSQPPRQPQPMYQPPRQQPDPRQLPPAYQSQPPRQPQPMYQPPRQQPDPRQYPSTYQSQSPRQQQPTSQSPPPGRGNGNGDQRRPNSQQQCGWPSGQPCSNNGSTTH
ncbi:MAG TPA: hypothetical protein VGZ23_11815 [bacterium]|nr:hypothetical protein [bacterium]